MDVGDVLLAARAKLATGKWCKGRYADGAGRFCAMGAIAQTQDAMFAPSGQSWRIVAGEAQSHLVCDAIQRLEHHVERRDVPAFNDALSTTLADMLNLFDKALADLGRLGDV